MALIGVNAIACAPRRPADPALLAMRWPTYAGSADRAASAGERVPDQPTRVWVSNVGRGAAGPPAVGDLLTVVMGVDRHLTALATADGTRRWRKRLNADGVGDPVIDRGRVFIASGGPEGTVSLRTVTGGDDRWERTVGPVAGPLALADSNVVAVSETGLVTALDTADGTVTWRRRLPGPVRGGATVLPAGLLVASFDSLFLLDATDGTVQQRAGAPAAVLGVVAVAGQQIVLGSPDQMVVGVGFDLAERWRVRTAGDVVAGAAVARDTAFAVTSNGVLYRIPLAAPSAYDSVMLGVTVITLPSPAANGVLVGATDGTVMFVQGTRARALFRADGPIEHPIVVRQGTLYVASGRGRVEAWR